MKVSVLDLFLSLKKKKKKKNKENKTFQKSAGGERDGLEK